MISLKSIKLFLFAVKFDPNSLLYRMQPLLDGTPNQYDIPFSCFNFLILQGNLFHMGTSTGQHKSATQLNAVVTVIMLQIYVQLRGNHLATTITLTSL